MIWKRMGILAISAAITCCLSGCSFFTTSTSNDGSDSETPAVSQDAEQTGTPAPDVQEETEQMKMPEAGEQVAIFHVEDYGDICVRLFPDKAPKAVENFVTHAKEGYYNGVTFHRVVDDFMIQGGDPTGTGAGGESIWKKPFEDEFSDDLLPLYGALCMANSGSDTNQSQFFIVQTNGSYGDYLSDLTDQQKKLFMKYGGTPWLVGKHTVFGQVYEGMDVVNKIAQCKTNNRDVPVEDVVISGIDIVSYVEATPLPEASGVPTAATAPPAKNAAN